jgi:uncharacterized protein YsxB (DUF464 family)
MKTQNNKLVALIEMHASANENGQDALCNALYHAINELARKQLVIRVKALATNCLPMAN